MRAIRDEQAVLAGPADGHLVRVRGGAGPDDKPGAAGFLDAASLDPCGRPGADEDARLLGPPDSAVGQDHPARGLGADAAHAAVADRAAVNSQRRGFGGPDAVLAAVRYR